jgi:catechol 2,3-dioxygenase-like lactoylglutathione lyase family enzyme
VLRLELVKTFRGLRATLGVAAISLLVASGSRAATAVVVLAPSNFIHVIGNMEQTVAFYHSVLGLDFARGVGKFAVIPAVSRLYALPLTTPMQLAILRLPDRAVALEFAQVRGVAQKLSAPRPQDPGASVLVLTVRSLEPILARVRAARVPIVTTGGGPVVIADGAGKSRVLVVKDPDGYYIELLERHPAPGQAQSGEPRPPSGNAAGNVLRASLMLSVANTDATVHVYRDLLGLPLRVDDSFAPDAGLSRALGVGRGAQLRHSVATLPGSDFTFDFVEWKGVSRETTQVRLYDRGAVVLRLVVDNVDTVVAHLKADGVPVASTGGGPVTINPLFHACILRDPSGFYFEAFPQLPPPTSRRRRTP